MAWRTMWTTPCGGRGFFSCYDCTERHVGCHSKCEKYKAEKDKYREFCEKVRRETLTIKHDERVMSMKQHNPLSRKTRIVVDFRHKD